jgi:cytochrome c oxidase subunit 1
LGDELPAAVAELRTAARIRSERPAFDLKYGPLAADLARDLPQRAVKSPQELHDECAAGGGASAGGEASARQPDPHSGARPVDVPEPEEVRRPDAPPAEPHDEAGAADRGGEGNVRWRTAGDPPSDDR